MLLHKHALTGVCGQKDKKLVFSDKKISFLRKKSTDVTMNLADQELAAGGMPRSDNELTLTQVG